MSQIILASASPRRNELLEQIGAEFVVCPAKGEEIITEEEPSAVVMELSRQKAEEVASGVLTYNEQHAELVTPQDILVIGADTVVAYENQILGKPKNEEDARRMLSMLAGCGSAGHTGFALIRLSDMAESCGCETTYVAFDEMSPEEIEAYISTDEPYDKAGAYGIQGRAALYIPGITGDYFNVMGLPLHAVYAAARDSFGVLLTEFE